MDNLHIDLERQLGPLVEELGGEFDSAEYVFSEGIGQWINVLYLGKVWKLEIDNFDEVWNFEDEDGNSYLMDEVDQSVYDPSFLGSLAKSLKSGITLAMKGN